MRKESIKTTDYSPWFLARNRKIGLQQNRISTERASQKEQNGTNFSFIAPSSEELWMRKESTPELL